MTYEEWVNNIEIIEKTNNEMILKQLENEMINDAINHNISEKLKQMIDKKFTNINNKVIAALDGFYDENEVDITMVNLKKEFKYLMRICNLKQIENRDLVIEEIKNGINEIYNILEEKTLNFDDSGMINLIIKNNRIKWSE